MRARLFTAPLLTPALTPEDRRLLAEAYDRMRKAADGDGPDADDAREGLADPFWVYYADLVLGGFERVRLWYELPIRAQEEVP